MSEILDDLPIFASRDDVFAAVSTPEGLDRRWTLTSSGAAEVGSAWELFSWAMYLRLPKRAVEHGEDVPHDRRLDV